MKYLVDSRRMQISYAANASLVDSSLELLH